MPDSENEVEHKTEEATIKLDDFEVAAEKIKEHITRGSKQLTVLSIVGMPGIGKTTLANSLYKDHSVTFPFHARAWCCVSKIYHKESLLLEILWQVNGKSNQSSQTDGKDCVEKLYKSLKGKRYLMVIDDIWDIEAWNDLKEIFPDDNNGSRILFTTRNHNVALEVNSVTYALSLLSDEQSWKLLREKVFEERRCPTELLQVGKEIAKVCKGLPLAVVTVAGILKTTERQQYKREQVAKSLCSKEAKNPLAHNFGILELCYSHLPNYLKPCFLYFASFREDAVISVSKLLWLWIAEGFVHEPNPSQISLENEAEKYLKDLVDRSLVMVDRKSSKGGVKSCRVHDLLLDFCLAKAEEEKFLLHMKSYGYHQLSTIYEDSVMHQAYHLCIKCDKHVVLPGPLRVRSLLLWRVLSYDELRMVNISQFRLLRVLDFSYILTVSGIDNKHFIKITNLVHLRFLAIQIRWPCIPSQIVNLQNLETLIVTSDSTRSSYIDLPKTIWNLVHLRHLYVKKGYFTFTGRRNVFFDNSDHLDNLETLSTIEFSLRNYFEKLASKLPGLRKLSCIVKMLWDPLIIHLNQIEELKLHFKFGVKHLLQFYYPSPYLKKLILSNLGRPWDEISVIGELPNLEVLKLVEGAFVGRQWDMREGEFQKLKFLKLCNLDIQEWNACSEHLPWLERLALHSCLCLEEIPSSAFGEISTLQSIEVKKCSSSIKQYVMQILDEQRDTGNDEFNVYIFGP
ncbi:hypothetical protein ACH5RR_036446 [Cinchona calisaya]|uniref:Uncharacterized protein n=1 Tax=Cinchona calisaya TaxID=153742 RepID=A0ABD2Y6E3_9GENT